MEDTNEALMGGFTGPFYLSYEWEWIYLIYQSLTEFWQKGKAMRLFRYVYMFSGARKL